MPTITYWYGIQFMHVRQHHSHSMVVVHAQDQDQGSNILDTFVDVIQPRDFGILHKYFYCTL